MHMCRSHRSSAVLNQRRLQIEGNMDGGNRLVNRGTQTGGHLAVTRAVEIVRQSDANTTEDVCLAAYTGQPNLCLQGF
jgi:hypothetical protein